MDLTVLFKGLVIGFSIAAPVGPIGVLCIRRTLAQGYAVGILTGLGAATADGLYGVVASFGLTFVSSFLLNQTTLLSLGGGLFLCYLGLKTLFARPALEAAHTRSGGLFTAYTSTFILTLTNPATILSFAGIFAGLGLAEAEGDYAQASGLVAGVFTGSALWWLMLSGGVSLLRTKLTPARLRGVNLVSGLIITGFGLLILLSLLP
ncbi:MAG TPA: LysE family transporter [Anaerolineae bacterium]|nr:LysE family transporter [Anaerolineae bacterium]